MQRREHRPDTEPRYGTGEAIDTSIVAYTYRVLIAVGIAGLAFLIWQVRDVLIIVFGGIVLATMLRALSDPLARHTPLSDTWALAVVVIALLVALGLLAWLFGERVSGQLSQLWTELPQAWSRFTAWLQQSWFGARLLDLAQSSGGIGGSLSRVTGVASATLGALADTVLILFLALFLAASPGLYRRGAMHLVPPAGRQAFAAGLDAAGHALKLWLLGQLIAMLAVGVLTWLGLWALGMPLALSLAFIAGLLEFVPIIGPIAAAVPAVLLGFTQGAAQALYVALLYLAIQQVESYLIMPMAQRWSVALPPALALIAVVIFWLLFGTLGVLFATPLMVVVLVLVQQLYVKRTLEAGQ